MVHPQSKLKTPNTKWPRRILRDHHTTGCAGHLDFCRRAQAGLGEGTISVSFSASPTFCAPPDHATEAPRPNTKPPDISITPFRRLKNRNFLRSISMLRACLARSGVTSSSTPSRWKIRYREVSRLPMWVSTDTSTALPAQDDRQIRSTTARPPFFWISARALSLRVTFIRFPRPAVWVSKRTSGAQSA